MVSPRALKIHGPNIGRTLRSQYQAASDPAWIEVGKLFFTEYTDKRFTPEHAREAGYSRRTAEYEKRKRLQFGHNNPLQKTGDTRTGAKRLGKIKSRGGTGQIGNQGGVSITYPGVRILNFQPRLREEFVRITAREATELGKYWESQFKPRFEKG